MSLLEGEDLGTGFKLRLILGAQLYLHQTRTMLCLRLAFGDFFRILKYSWRLFRRCEISKYPLAIFSLSNSC